ncbi:MAG: alpha/beta hydrolase [Thermoanaerobaculia bacterium]
MMDPNKQSITSDPRKAFLLGGAAAGLAGAVGVAAFLRERIQHRRLFLPDRYPNGVWDPRPFGLEAEDVWFEAADGVRLHGWWVPRKRARATLLYCHGNWGSIAHQVGALKLLSRLGFDVFAFDYRGYGRSEGRPSEKGLYLDARAAHDHLTSTRGVDPRRLFIFGHSLGGAVAIDCALDRQAAGLIVQATFTDVADASRAAMPLPGISWVTRNQFRSVRKIGQLALPKLIIHGTEDGTVPVELGRRLYEAAAEPKQLLLVPGASHNNVPQHGGLRYYLTLARFRARCLKQATRPLPEPAPALT